MTSKRAHGRARMGPSASKGAAPGDSAARTESQPHTGRAPHSEGRVARYVSAPGRPGGPPAPWGLRWRRNQHGRRRHRSVLRLRLRSGQFRLARRGSDALCGAAVSDRDLLVGRSAERELAERSSPPALRRHLPREPALHARARRPMHGSRGKSAGELRGLERPNDPEADSIHASNNAVFGANWSFARAVPVLTVALG